MLNDEEKIKELLKKWRERLLDLSVGNPLMDLTKSKVAKLKIIHPSLENIFHILYEEDKELKLPSTYEYNNSELADVKFEETDFHRKLRHIYRNAKVALEERGLPTLHIVLGTLSWEDQYRLGKAKTPLLLLPCVLGVRSVLASMELRATGEEVIVNPALKLYLHEIYGKDLPELSEEISLEKIQDFFGETTARIQAWGAKWAVEPEVWLTTLSFDSFVLYQDLRVLEPRAVKHPVIKAFANATAASIDEGGRNDGVIHEQDPEETRILDEPMLFVLPADSSQREALILARKGKNVVIHGPPGTGKSQTITNLIADFLWRGKTVLFVSAKMAALEVVYKRLQDLGLDRFCLELYSAKANKGKVIEDLKRTLSLASSEPPQLTERWKEILADLLTRRDEINAYVAFLHNKKSPIGLSLYEILGRLEKLKHVPVLDFPLPWSNPLNVTQEELTEVVRALSDLCDRAETFEHQDEHPWRGFTPRSGIDSSYVEHCLKVLLDGVENIGRCLQMLEPLVGAVQNATVQEIYNLKELLSPLASVSPENYDLFLYPMADLEECFSTGKTAIAKASELEVHVTKHGELWKISPPDLFQMLSVLKTEYIGISRFMQKGYWRWRKQIAKYARPGVRVTHAMACQSLWRVERILRLTEELQSVSRDIGERINRPVACEVRALNKFITDLQTIVEWKRRIGSTKDNSQVVFQEMYKDAIVKLTQILNSQEFKEALKRVDELWPNGFIDGKRCEEMCIRDIAQRCREIISGMNLYIEWIYYMSVMQKCLDLGLKHFIDKLPKSAVRLADKVFLRRFYEVWVRRVFEENPKMSKYTSVTFEKLRDEFRRLDNELRAAWLAFVKARAVEPGIRVAKADPSYGTLTEVGILRKELQKTRKFKPLRKLFSEVPNVLKALKPCFLMSPLSVSAFLDPEKYVFDVVIFDEASQIPTQEAIPAVVRGKQVIVAGDAKQLPPSSFFKASFIWEIAESEDSYEEMGSFLEECISTPGTFAEAHLRWHYRSRDERLIAFSNYYFYRDNPLLTFPYPAVNSPDTGVRLEYLPNGIWDRGKTRTNRVEAEKVAELVYESVKRNPHRSLGVVAMNVEQCEIIEEYIERLCDQHPEIAQILYGNEDEPFFVKSLENVQGDERDVIIISLGFGRDPHGILTYNFGPLGQENGWRRLNVLITRARWQIIVVTSLRAHELSSVKTTGATRLRDFLEYVEKGCKLPAPLPRITASETNPFEDSVAQAIRDLGYQVDEQVGVGPYRIDIAVRDPRDVNRYLAAVECDGATYHSTPDARDRDILREEILRALGWRILRVWSTDWFWRREKTIASLKQSLEELLKTPLELSVQAAQGDCQKCNNANHEKNEKNKHAESSSKYTFSLKYSSGKPYQKYKEPGSRYYMLFSQNYKFLSHQILKILEIEGPIHKSLLIERLKEVNDVARVGKKISANVELALSHIKREIQVDDEGFIKLKDRQIVDFRTPADGVHRPPHLISADEIKVAVLHVVEEQFSCSREAVSKALARIFGWRKTSEASEKRVQKIIDELIAERKLQEMEGWISLVG
ncbi:MAG: DUF3320 domain-containing protein [Nitrososphaerota archaeon]